MKTRPILFIGLLAMFIWQGCKKAELKADPELVAEKVEETSKSNLQVNAKVFVPAITVSPATFLPKSVINIKGNYFATTKDSIKIEFNGVNAKVDSIMADGSVLVTVPAITGTGNVSVISRKTKVLAPYKALQATLEHVVDAYAISISGAKNSQVFGSDLYKVFCITRKVKPILVYSGRINYPAMDRDLDGTAYAVEQIYNYPVLTNDIRILKVTKDGVMTVLSQRSGLSLDPRDVHVDKGRNVYVNNYPVRGSITKFTPDGSESILTNQLGYTTKFAVDENSNIFIIDDNKWLKKVTPNGTITTLSGGGKALGGITDGKADKATFGAVVGVGADKQGNIFVAQTNGKSIRMVNRLGEVTTLVVPMGSNGDSYVTGPVQTGGLEEPFAISMGWDGILYIAHRQGYAERISNGTSIISRITFQ